MVGWRFRLWLAESRKNHKAVRRADGAGWTVDL
jgi:hypothetical protein